MSSPAIPEHLKAVQEALLRQGHNPGQASALLQAVTENASTQAPIRELKIGLGDVAGDDALERLLLFHATARTLPRVDELPVHDSVKRLLRAEMESLPVARGALKVGTYDFVWASRIATLRRFTAGPMDWEISGVPRSWMWQAGVGMFRLGWFTATRLGGFRPCFVMHVARRPRSRAMVLEKEVNRSYYRIARSLELQPEMRALVAAAWFHDPQAEAQYPHLSVLSRPYRENGGIVIPLGPAGLDSGVLEGNAERRKQVEAGELSYRVGLAIWPRNEIIAWARAHPEHHT